MGYLAPECLSTGCKNLKMDVYSFGVVMLEVLTGKEAYFPFSQEEWEDKKAEACKGREKREQEDTEEPERAKQHNFAPRSLVDYAVSPIETGELWKVLDRRPAAKPTPRQLEAAELVAQAAVRCVSLDWEARPSISEVVATLETALEVARCDG
ncbi:unnamed protein product [Urochloa humidicola]